MHDSLTVEDCNKLFVREIKDLQHTPTNEVDKTESEAPGICGFDNSKTCEFNPGEKLYPSSVFKQNEYNKANGHNPLVTTDADRDYLMQCTAAQSKRAKELTESLFNPIVDDELKAALGGESYNKKETSPYLEISSLDPREVEKRLLSEATSASNADEFFDNAFKNLAASIVEEKQAIKYDQGKAELSILPIEGLKYEAAALTYGKGKYGKGNFKLGMEHSRLIDAALRHIYAYAGGETLDKESNLHHLAHAKATLAMLIYMIENNVGKDDR